MWTSATMTVGEALIYSVTALAIVFLALISIALFVKIISAAVNAIVKEDDKPAAKTVADKPSAKPVEQSQDVSLTAAIIAAVSEETKLPVDKFQIVSIEERK